MLKIERTVEGRSRRRAAPTARDLSRQADGMRREAHGYGYRSAIAARFSVPKASPDTVSSTHDQIGRNRHRRPVRARPEHSLEGDLEAQGRHAITSRKSKRIGKKG